MVVDPVCAEKCVRVERGICDRLGDVLWILADFKLLNFLHDLVMLACYSC